MGGLLDYKGPIGIVGYENVVFGIDTLSQVIGINLVPVIFKKESEAPFQVAEVASKGVTEFVGDIYRNSIIIVQVKHG